MSVSLLSKSQITSTVPTLTEDPFAQTVIRRCVGRLLRCPEFAPHEAEDLHQDLQAELDRAMRSHDATIGQRIRRRRVQSATQNPNSMPKVQIDWQEAFLAAIRESKARTEAQLESGSWRRCLHNKMTSYRSRRTLNA